MGLRSPLRLPACGPEQGSSATEIAMCRAINADRIANSFKATRFLRALFEGTPAGGSTSAEAQAKPGRGPKDSGARPPVGQVDNL
jgi:hypothetical protein